MNKIIEMPNAARTATRVSKAQTCEARWPVTVYSFHKPPVNWNACMNSLKDFRSLRDDWDGDDAIPPSKSTVDFTIDYVQKMERLEVGPPDRVLPGVNGTIVFEWQNNRGITVIEVIQPNDIETRFYPV